MPLNFDLPVPTVTITPYDHHSLGAQLGLVTPISTAFPSINRAYYIPFLLYKPATAYKMFVVNGATLSGNFDMGIYDRTGLRLASIGSTAQVGVNDYQEIVLASPLKLGAGFYWMAIAADNDVTTFMRRSLGTAETEAVGGYQEANAFPLPAQATFDDISTSYIPLMGVRFFNA